jgi:Zn-dependent protease
MSGGIKLGRIFGIEITIHPTWFIIMVVLTWSLATSVFPAAFAAGKVTYWLTGAIASLLLFASVLVHELAHSLIARHQGIPVKSITLFLLGGVSSIEKEASSPGREAVMAGAGPLTSLLLGGVFLVAGVLLKTPAAVHATLTYLGVVNIALAIFNILPGFPLDGGRVLRAALWARSHDFVRATRGAARTGHVFGYVMILGGVLLAVSGNLFAGVWIGFVGWVLLQASQAAYQQVVAERSLRGVSAARLMRKASTWIPPFVTLESAAHDYFLSNNTRCLPVEGASDGTFDGIVCLSDLQRRPHSEWGHDRVHDIMIDRADVVTVGPHQPASEVLKLMTERNVNQVAVVDNGDLLGFIDRTSALDFLHRHTVDGSGYDE